MDSNIHPNKRRRRNSPLRYLDSTSSASSSNILPTVLTYHPPQGRPPLPQVYPVPLVQAFRRPLTAQDTQSFQGPLSRFEAHNLIIPPVTLTSDEFRRPSNPDTHSEAANFLSHQIGDLNSGDHIPEAVSLLPNYGLLFDLERPMENHEISHGRIISDTSGDTPSQGTVHTEVEQGRTFFDQDLPLPESHCPSHDVQYLLLQGSYRDGQNFHQGHVHFFDQIAYGALPQRGSDHQILTPRDTVISTNQQPNSCPTLYCQEPDCDSKYTGIHAKRNLTRHVIAKHTDKEYKCQICGKVLERQDALRNHVRRLHPPLHGSAVDSGIVTGRIGSTGVTQTSDTPLQAGDV